MSKNKITGNQTFGIGYATVIMLFVVIFLSIIALLSYNAAGMNESLAKNNSTYITSYYSAERRAVERIAELDGIAYRSHKGMFFEESFETAAAELDGIEYRRSPEGYTVSFSEEVNSRLSLSVKLTFFYEPSMHGGKRYTVDEYRTRAVSGGEEGSLGLWDGKTPIGV